MKDEVVDREREWCEREPKKEREGETGRTAPGKREYVYDTCGSIPGVVCISIYVIEEN